MATDKLLKKRIQNLIPPTGRQKFQQMWRTRLQMMRDAEWRDIQGRGKPPPLSSHRRHGSSDPTNTCLIPRHYLQRLRMKPPWQLMRARKTRGKHKHRYHLRVTGRPATPLHVCICRGTPKRPWRTAQLSVTCFSLGRPGCSLGSVISRPATLRVPSYILARWTLVDSRRRDVNSRGSDRIAMSRSNRFHFPPPIFTFIAKFTQQTD